MTHYMTHAEITRNSILCGWIYDRTGFDEVCHLVHAADDTLAMDLAKLLDAFSTVAQAALKTQEDNR